MFNLFKKKEKDPNVYAPVTGRCIRLDDVSDAVFSSRMMGDGIAFELLEDTIYAPCDATIMMIAGTKHAIGLQADNGLEILIHVGLDTVNLNGEGFIVHKQAKEHVSKGEPLLTINRSFMKEHSIDLTTPMIITNGNDVKVQIQDIETSVKAETIVFIKKT